MEMTHRLRFRNHSQVSCKLPSPGNHAHQNQSLLQPEQNTLPLYCAAPGSCSAACPALGQDLLSQSSINWVH